ncbi:Bacteriophage replication protein O, partial [Haemophilus influenzae]
MIPDS